MTSGLFNTGVAGDSAEITSHTPLAAQPSTSMSAKVVGHDDFLMETFDTADFDMNMFGDLGGAGFDPLADASLDSFTDLSALLSEQNAFLDPSDDGELEPLPDLSKDLTPTTTPLKRSFDEIEAPSTSFNTSIDETVAPSTSFNTSFDEIVVPSTVFDSSFDEIEAPSTSLKRSFDQMEAGSSDLNDLSARVGLATSSTHDHDYSSKRPRMSTVTEEPSEEAVFLAPSPLPLPHHAPSTPSSIIIDPWEDKSRSRREKNNIASKRSREIRKQKFATMETEADRLIADNARLEKRVAQLERLAKQMKEILVAKMAGK